MKKYSWIILCLVSSFILSMNSFAEVTNQSPTSSSSPIPTLSKTKNIDTVMTEKVQAAIVKTPSLDGQAVSAASHDGVVTLQGSVENKSQENDAIAAARSVPGVSEVTSQLTIKNQ